MVLKNIVFQDLKCKMSMHFIHLYSNKGKQWVSIYINIIQNDHCRFYTYFLTSADVVALYPSISIEDGLAALTVVYEGAYEYPRKSSDLYLHLARFVLENNYIECKGLDNCTICLQKIGWENARVCDWI